MGTLYTRLSSITGEMSPESISYAGTYSSIE